MMWKDRETGYLPEEDTRRADRLIAVGLVLAIVLSAAVAFQQDKLPFGGENPAVQMLDNAQAVYRENKDVGKLVKVSVSEPDGESVALRKLPAITTDSQESNVIRRVPSSNETFYSVVVFEAVDGKLWGYGDFGGDRGFVLKQNLQVAADQKDFEVIDVRTGEVASLRFDSH